MRFLPVFLDTAAGVVIVVGSGEPALGKLRLLRAAGGHVRWFSADGGIFYFLMAIRHNIFLFSRLFRLLYRK